MSISKTLHRLQDHYSIIPEMSHHLRATIALFRNIALPQCCTTQLLSRNTAKPSQTMLYGTAITLHKVRCTKAGHESIRGSPGSVPTGIFSPNFYTRILTGMFPWVLRLMSQVPMGIRPGTIPPMQRQVQGSTTRAQRLVGDRQGGWKEVCRQCGHTGMPTSLFF